MHRNTLLPEALLAFAWQHGIFDRVKLRTRDDEAVVVVDPGRKHTGKDSLFTEAELRIGDKTYVGKVAIHEKASGWGYAKRNYDPDYDGVILNVVAEDDRMVRKVDDTVLPAVRLAVPERLTRTYQMLLTNAAKVSNPKSAGTSCSCYLHRIMSEIEFKAACTRLMIERLERKYNDILEIYDRVEKSWHETFHVLLFRSIGMGRDQDQYMSLARHVPYAKLCKERGDLENIEAMLFGVSGLLDPSVYNPYAERLSERFEVLRHRHQLRVLSYCQWTEKGIRPHSFPPNRIAQLAGLINNNEFTFNNLLTCESIDDVRHLFRIELSKFWKHSFSFSARTEKKQEKIGDDTIDILIINLVVPILFAYGRMKSDEELEERALELLYCVKGERNRYTNAWRSNGIKIEHALTSQAVIQLSKEFCTRGRCTECFLGVRMLKNNA